MKDDYQIYEQVQWPQSPSHSKTHHNYVSSDSPLWGYSVDDNQDILSINGICFEMLKRSIGVIYNVNQSIAEDVTSLTTLSIWKKMNSIKPYQKTFQQSGVPKTTSAWTT